MPKLIDGPLVGYPRVFGIAWAFVAHTDEIAISTRKCWSRFVRAYQRVQPLTIGELWAIAITLRIVLVENLRRLAEGIVAYEAARQEANRLADRLLGTGDRLEVEPVGAVLEPIARTPVGGAGGPASPAAARPGPEGAAGARLAGQSPGRPGQLGRYHRP